MKTVKISVEKREKISKPETRRLRKEEMVPCVMYGGEKNYHFYTHQNNFLKVVYSPEVHLIEIDMQGEKHKGLIQDIQFHPVTDKILHIDFIEVFDEIPVIATIPIRLEGVSIGVKNGGRMRQRRRYLKVKGLIQNMPEHLVIDITNMDINDTIKISDLDYPNLEILDPHQSMVLSVVSSRVAMKSMIIEEEPSEAEEAEEGAVAAEGEEGGESGEGEKRAEGEE